MLTARWIIAGILIAFSLFVALSQWYCMFTIPKKLNAQGQPRHYSIAPLFGGVIGVIGCLLAPHETTRALWWVPLVLDPGCLLLFGSLAVFGLVHLFRRRKKD